MSDSTERRLWVVTRTYESFALAESEYKAIAASKDSIRWEEPIEEGYEWHGGALPAGWDAGCLVYHEGDEDITVPQAIEIAEREKPAVRCPYTLELGLAEPSSQTIEKDETESPIDVCNAMRNEP